ncbi:hypothetical protein [Planobispora rosea]|uniref:hypothetical protein n=1 Tax=Planobispora rosea TaxID=35762 RepID=UPI00083AFCE3|nr:hypothetical protein [Planobispora rosea]
MNTATTPPTPENVAEMLTSGDNDYHDGNDWHLGISSADNVVHITITPYTEDGDELPEAHFCLTPDDAREWAAQLAAMANVLDAAVSAQGTETDR